MDVFLIIDDLFELKFIAPYLKRETRVTLFSLTSHFFKIKTITDYLQAHCSQVVIIDSSKCINDEVLIMQRNLLVWSSRLANHKIGNKSLKEWFALPDRAGSAWWFSLISEKNAVQEPKFFQIAQINAIATQFKKKSYATCLIAIKDKNLRHIIKRLMPTARLIPKTKQSMNVKARLLNSPFISALINIAVWVKQHYLAKKSLPPLESRLQKVNPFLFISYFPNIDNQAAEQGRFINKYAGKLQTKLAEMNISISWLLMPVFYNGHDYKSSLSLAKHFADHGENLFVLQEFCNWKVLVKSIVWGLRQALLGAYLYKRIDKNILTEGLTKSEALPLIKYFWQQSFLGAANVRGMLFYLTFQNILMKLPMLKTALYYCEMQAWEKAFLMAKNSTCPSLKTFAFQHTVIGRNYYNYFYHPNDTLQRNHPFDFPLPDKLIANGKRMHDFLAESKFKDLIQAEAIRHLYLHDLQERRSQEKTKPILFLGGSCDKTEMIALLTMFYQAYPQACDFEVWIKASPVMPVEPIFREIGIDITKTNYQIFHADVSKLLSQVDIALIANTTVAIEAAAIGCPVLVPVFADTLLMNPIIGTQAHYIEVGSVEELKTAIKKLLRAPKNKVFSQFIDDYWNVNPDLPLWTNIICSEMR